MPTHSKQHKIVGEMTMHTVLGILHASSMREVSLSPSYR